MQPDVPPNFVNAPTEPTYDAELSDAVFRTYIRLRGLAWQSRYRQTRPLTIGEIARVCHRNERSMWGHLRVLRSRNLLSWRTSRGRMVITFPLQNLAINGEGEGGIASSANVVFSLFSSQHS